MEEGLEPVISTVCERYHKATEFMFWGAFSWDYKGLCHYWQPETKVKKEEVAKIIAEMNAKKEPSAQAKWEFTTISNRLHLDQNVFGVKPQ